jgi:hypothetical protein
MNKSKLKKRALKILKITVFVIVPFLLSSIGDSIFPSKADLIAEQAQMISDGVDSEIILRSYFTGEYDSKITSNKFRGIVFTAWGIIALFFVIRSAIRWVARTAATAVREANKQE